MSNLLRRLFLFSLAFRYSELSSPPEAFKRSYFKRFLLPAEEELLSQLSFCSLPHALREFLRKRGRIEQLQNELEILCIKLYPHLLRSNIYTFSLSQNILLC